MGPPSAPPKHTIFGVERAIDIPATIISMSQAETEIERRLPLCEHGWFDSCYASAKLHYRKWIPTTTIAPKAVVIFMHGICTHSGKALVLSTDANKKRKLNSALQAEALLKENIAMYAFDLYGHGFSEGTRLLIPDTYQTNLQDYIAFCHIVAKEHTPDTPIFLMGESYGSTLTLHVAKHFQGQATASSSAEALANLDSLVLVCPAVIGDLPPYPVVQILRFLARYYPLWRPFFMPNPISPERIWRDPVVRDLHVNKDDPANVVDGSGLPFRLGTALNLVKAMEDVRTITIPALKVPYLILHGTDDYGVPIQGSELLWEKSATTEKEFLRKQGAYHDLLADYVAEECMQDIVDWIHKRIALREKK